VILGGTNDLSSMEPDELYSKVINLHKIAHDKGLKTVVITIPGFIFDFFLKKKQKNN